MKLIISTVFVAMTFSFAVHADQKATLTCSGSNVILSVKSPYLGEDSAAIQELFVLKSVNSIDESSYTAFFLDVEQDIGGVQHGGAGTLVFTGSNSAGGSFQMIIEPWTDESDEALIRQTSKGKITYSHGPLKGQDEAVSCVLE